MTARKVLAKAEHPAGDVHGRVGFLAGNRRLFESMASPIKVIQLPVRIEFLAAMSEKSIHLGALARAP